MLYLYVAVLLAIFWLVLSGYYTALLLSLGVVSVALVVWFLWRMNRVDKSPITLYPGLGGVSYLAWLMWQVVLSNVDVAKRIWDPKLPIDPTWQRLDVKQASPLQRTLYANSITLTPGTLTTDVHDDHFMIHALTPEGLEDLRKGEMQDRILKLDI